VIILPKPVILSIDTGGTMSDTVLVSEDSDFVIGKAQTTPEFEAKGIINSLKDAAFKWNLSVEDAVKDLKIIIYTGTIMLNRILEYKGLSSIGIITTAGFEDTLKMGRSRQAWNTLSYGERLHAISHFHPKPLIPRNLIMGVRERVLVTGTEAIPLYEDEVKKSVETLINRGVTNIIIMFLNSWANPSHEIKAAEIALNTAKEMNKTINIFLSHKIAPILGELRRLNAVVIQVYAAEPSRKQFELMDQEFRKSGFKGSLYVYTNYGTLVSPSFERLIHTVKSGPSGGNSGVKYLADLYNLDYIVGADIGGTSFDVTTIVAKQPFIEPYTLVSKYEVAVPSVKVDSIGAGTGSFVRLDPTTKSLHIGPDSAGYRIGMSWPEGKVNNVTLNDVMLTLGYLNPDYFLGGSVKLHKDIAVNSIKEQIADELKIDVIDAAWEIYKMQTEEMKFYLESLIRGLGFSPELFSFVIYGGGGPSMVAAISQGLRFNKVMVPELAPAFSAYGASLSDLGIRLERSLESYIPPLPGVEPKGIAIDMMNGIAKLLNIKLSVEELESVRELLYTNSMELLKAAWSQLKDEIKEEFEKAGIKGEIAWKGGIRMQYAGMLDDIEVSTDTIDVTKEFLVNISNKFDSLFEKIYASSARSKEFGYVITRAILTGYMSMSKPFLKTFPEEGTEPSKTSYKGTREIYWDNKWVTAKIFEMGLLKPGNVIEGPSIIEAPAATFVVPPGFRTRLDSHRIFLLEEVKSSSLGGENK
jgi:N-methylhydantoinase A/acetone carboxylase beta subunit